MLNTTLSELMMVLACIVNGVVSLCSKCCTLATDFHTQHTSKQYHTAVTFVPYSSAVEGGGGGQGD